MKSPNRNISAAYDAMSDNDGALECILRTIEAVMNEKPTKQEEEKEYETAS